jgi:hypothetical protein
MIDHSVYPLTTDDLEKDFVLSERIRIFSWVRERHLDVPEGEASQGFLAFAEQGECKVTAYVVRIRVRHGLRWRRVL